MGTRHRVVERSAQAGIACEGIEYEERMQLLDSITPATQVAAERLRLARDLLADVERLETQRRDSKARIAAAVTASGTTLTEIFGIGAVVAATVIV